MATTATRTLADVGDDELINIVLKGLGASTSTKYRKHFNGYRKHRDADSIGAALRELLASTRRRAEKLLERYKASLQDRGLACVSINDHIRALKGAIRQARLAGITAISFDPERRRSTPPAQGDLDGPLLDLAMSGLSSSTAATYRAYLIEFARYNRVDSIEAVLSKLVSSSHDDANQLVRDYLSSMKSRGQSDASVATLVSILNRSVRNIRRAGLTTLAIDIDRPHLDRASPWRSLGEEDWTRLLAKAEALANTSPGQARNVVLILLLYYRVLWPREVIALDLADVDLAAPAIRVGGEWLPMNAPTCDALARWIEIRGKWQGPLFTQGKESARECRRLSNHGLLRIIKRLGLKAGVGANLTPIHLRQGGLDKAAQLGYDARDIQAFSRNSWGPPGQIMARQSRSGVDIGVAFPERHGRVSGMPTIKDKGRKPHLSSQSDIVVIYESHRFNPVFRGKIIRVSRNENLILIAMAKYKDSNMDTNELTKKSGVNNPDVYVCKMRNRDKLLRDEIETPGPNKQGSYRIPRGIVLPRP
jgi:site-specific recombinase XerD